MTSNLALVTVDQLVRDTFRQSRAQGVFWLLLGISAICILLCASVSINGAVQLAGPGENPDFLPRTEALAHESEILQRDGVAVVGGDLSLGFGAVRVPLARRVDRRWPRQPSAERAPWPVGHRRGRRANWAIR